VKPELHFSKQAKQDWKKLIAVLEVLQQQWFYLKMENLCILL